MITQRRRSAISDPESGQYYVHYGIRNTPRNHFVVLLVEQVMPSLSATTVYAIAAINPLDGLSRACRVCFVFSSRLCSVRLSIIA